MSTLFKKKFEFLTKKEKVFLFGSLIITSIIVCFNFDKIEESNLATSATELTYAGLLAFMLAKYFFKKEEVSVTKKELQAKLNNLDVIGLEINTTASLLQDISKQDLSFYQLTSSEKKFLENKENVSQDMEDVDIKIDTILEITKIHFIDNPTLMPILKEIKKYLSSSKNRFKMEDYSYMGLEISNAVLTLKNYEEIINNLTEQYTNSINKL